MKHLDNRTPIENPATGKPFQAPDPAPGEQGQPMTISTAVQVFVRFANPQRSLEDDKHAFRVVQAARRADGKAYLQLEDADYAWLLKTYRKQGPVVFVEGGDAWAIYQALQRTVRPAPARLLDDLDGPPDDDDGIEDDDALEVPEELAAER